MKLNQMKIKKNQLKEIKSIQEELNKTLTSIGYLESQKHALLHDIKSINERDLNMKKELEKEYGAVEINIDDGTYKPVKEKTIKNV